VADTYGVVDRETMTTHSTKNDLFVASKGKLPRSMKRGKSTPDGRRPGSPQDGVAEIDREVRANIIRNVLSGERISTVFQAIVDLQTGKTVGAEALSRFTAPILRNPEVWFAEASALGFGVELELAAIRCAMAEFPRLPSDLYMALNISAPTILSKDIRSALAEAPPDRLVLELTAPVHHEDAKGVVRALHKLRAHGLRLAVDNAGNGQTNSTVELQPDIFKLDVRGARSLNGDNARQALGSALLRFGMNPSKSVLVAEGIETETEFEILRSLGCRFGQGFYLGRPGRLRDKSPRHASTGQLWVDEEEPSAASTSETDEPDEPADTITAGATS
jgi:EAL domain-containing protein (putative c-di-GMP-specific phosphodiesterase class I)